jgi:hypothetical protein
LEEVVIGMQVPVISMIKVSVCYFYDKGEVIMDNKEKPW